MEMKKTALREWDVVACTYGELLSAMDAWRRDGKRHFVCFCDANGLVHGWRESELADVYRQADAVCADGIATDWLTRICGGKGGRLIGPKLFPTALEYGVSRGWRHFFYGADADTLAVLKAKMERRFPGVKIVGAFAPGFATDPELPQLEKGAVDFLWVALGCPKQEKWCARHLKEVDAPVLMPVGAAFDFISGKVADTPAWVHRMGFCWLWRLCTGGTRVLGRNVKCVSIALAIVMREFVRVRILRKSVR